MYEITASKIESARQALNIKDRVLTTYNSAIAVRDLLALYSQDPTYTSAVNAIYTQAERADLAAIATECSTFAADLLANHPNIFAAL